MKFKVGPVPLAFRRGRRSRSLDQTGVDDRLLDRTVGELRAELHIPPDPVTPTGRDCAAFVLWVAITWLG